MSNLKCFSLFSFRHTIDCGKQIVPLFCQMSQLEKLKLSLIVCYRTSFIDGTHPVNDILSKISYPHTFIFDITYENVIISKELLPTSDDVQHTLIRRAFNI